MRSREWPVGSRLPHRFRGDFPSKDTESAERQEKSQRKSNRGDEGAVGNGVAVGHAGRVKGEAGGAAFVEQDEAASTLTAIAEELHGSLRGAGRIGAGGTEEIAGGFGEDDFHDGFAVTGGGDGSGFVIGVTTTTDEGRIADPAGEFAAGAAGGGGGIQAA